MTRLYAPRVAGHHFFDAVESCYSDSFHYDLLPTQSLESDKQVIPSLFPCILAIEDSQTSHETHDDSLINMKLLMRITKVAINCKSAGILYYSYSLISLIWLPIPDSSDKPAFTKVRSPLTKLCKGQHSMNE